MNIPFRRIALAAVVLALVHSLLALVPGPTLSISMNLALFATNLYVVLCALLTIQREDAARLGLFALGYLILFVLLILLMDRKPLFMILIVMYASVFRSPLALGVFGLFVLSFVILQPYAIETFLPLLGMYVVLTRAKPANRFLKACLGLGLAGLLLALMPVFHLLVQDSAQTLWHTLARPDVRAALGVSLLTATIATFIILLFGVPLAYGMARLVFPGRRFIETLIDIPILVPQSVAGIAMMVFLGPGSPLGIALFDGFGLQISGTLVAIVVAQIFVGAPFLIKSALAGFEAVPERFEHAARTLGAGPATTFWRVSLPLAFRGITIGATLAWARAISEFGAIVLFASYPVSAPILVHSEFVRAGASESRPLAVLLLIVCLWLFVVLQFGQTFVPFAWKQWKQRVSP